MIFKTDEELQTKCEEWQKRLRLQDWIVQCKIVRARDMTLGGACAECDPVLRRKLAVIRIRDPLDYPETYEKFNQDMEWDLIHELLHLHFFPFTTEETDNTTMEQCVDILASSLINLYRASLPQAKKELKAV